MKIIKPQQFDWTLAPLTIIGWSLWYIKIFPPLFILTAAFGVTLLIDNWLE